MLPINDSSIVIIIIIIAIYESMLYSDTFYLFIVYPSLIVNR